jgi:hypothetical protein
MRFEARAHPGEAGGEAKAIAIMKNGAALLLGGSRPEGRRKCSMCCRNLSIQMSAQQQSSPRSATSVNPSAEAIFWTTFILPDTVASMPTQAAPRIRRAAMVQDEHFAAAGLLGRVMARLRGF